MTDGSWLREDRADLATERILDAAEAEIAEAGVAGATMAAIAVRAGCSRATVYAYFPNRHQLRLAVVNRGAVRVAREVVGATATIDDPGHRLTEALLRSVEAVRSTPTLAAWFRPAEQGYAHELAHSSQVVDAVTSGFVEALGGDAEDQALRAQWIVRVVISLLTAPGRDQAEERALVERIVTPGLLATTNERA